jgi:6-phosphogluconolactonase
VSDVELVVLEDERAAARAAGELLARAATEGAHIALSGGSTVGPAFEIAAQLQPDWGAAKVWWGDDRAVPPDDERSNYLLAKHKLLERLERTPRALHRIRGELGAEAAANEYDRLLEGVELGLALNGIGPDGHTASLFPNAPALDERERRAVAAEARLEPFVDRVTMTIRAFATAGELVYLVAGEEKAEAVRRAFAAEPGPETPASLVRGRRTVAILDVAAAGRLDSSISRTA